QEPDPPSRGTLDPRGPPRFPPHSREHQRMDTEAPTPLLTPEYQLTEMHSAPPYGRLRRWVPMAWTVIVLWVRWRWLRVKRRIYAVEAMTAATHEFLSSAAEAVVNRAIKQQGLIIKTCQFLGSRADILMDEYVRTLSLVHDRVPPRPWSEMKP